MEQETAMQKMIEWAISIKDKKQQCIDWIAIKSKAEELLAMEKEQIIDFAKQWEARQNDGNLDTIEMLYNKMYNE
jgi:hypothetical protein